MNARDEILGRIRAALADRPEAVAVPREYRRKAPPGDVQRFVDRVADYRAGVHHAHESVAATVTGVLTGHALHRVIVPDGFPADWLPDIELIREPVDVATLDRVSAVITSCRLAIAETGTIVLDAGAGMGPRSLTLVPDYHLVVVRADQVVGGVPDAVAALDPTRPLTWISGPSATSDIELDRVEGVHGPRTLDVVLAPLSR
jgi:L-lactate dehydrogenase complex protein LldG